MPAKPLTDAIDALTAYANEVTGESDTTLSEAVHTLADGYGRAEIIDLYDNYEWSYTAGRPSLLTRISRGVFDKSVESARRGLFTTENDVTNRCSFVVSKGRAPIVTETNYSALPYYPIPIPATATKAKLLLSDSNLVINAYVERYEEPNLRYPYVRTRYWGSVAYNAELTFTAGENQFLAFNIKYSDDSDITSIPDFSIVFE